MKNVITAILNPEINLKLNKNKKINVVCKDILYQEAIFEILEKNENIDFIILSSMLPGEEKIEKIITKINNINKNIKIICFENKNEEIVNKNIYKKYLKENLSCELLEKIILNKEEIVKKNNLTKKIIFLGNRGSGKSIILANISLILSKQKQKVIILDFDINKTNYLIFNLKNKKAENSGIIKINSYLFYIGNFNKSLLKKQEILKLIEELEKNFDFLLIDTSGNFSEIEKILIKNSNKQFFITEANISELKKTKNILQKYKNNKIKSELFQIILNKNNLNSIDDTLIKKIIKNNIIEKIKYSNKFNRIINEKIKEIIERKDFIKIIKKIKE